MKPTHLVSRLRAIVCVLVFSAVASGCGFVISRAPPEGHGQMDYFTCTESDAGPIIDAIWGGLNVVSVVLIAADPDAYDSPGAYIAAGLAWGVFSASAATVGFNKAKKCRAAKQQLAARQAALRAVPPAGQPAVQAVVIAPHADTLVVGERVQLTATAHTSDGRAIPNAVFAWSSSNDAIASVSNAGLVTAHANGSAVIAARTNNVDGTATIVVLSRR